MYLLLLFPFYTFFPRTTSASFFCFVPERKHLPETGRQGPELQYARLPARLWASSNANHVQKLSSVSALAPVQKTLFPLHALFGEISLIRALVKLQEMLIIVSSYLLALRRNL